MCLVLLLVSLTCEWTQCLCRSSQDVYINRQKPWFHICLLFFCVRNPSHPVIKVSVSGRKWCNHSWLEDSELQWFAALCPPTVRLNFTGQLRRFNTSLTWRKCNSSSHSYSLSSSEGNYPDPPNTHTQWFIYTHAHFLAICQPPSLYISSWQSRAPLTHQASAFSCSVALAVNERDFFCLSPWQTQVLQFSPCLEKVTAQNHWSP